MIRIPYFSKKQQHVFLVTENMGGLSPGLVILAMLAVTFMIIAIRFLWVSGLELK